VPGFPLDRYTPHGYLDNPRHAWRTSRSGVLRSLPGIGFAWHVPSYPGPYGKRWIYQAELQLELDPRPADLYVEHHTTTLFRYRAGAASAELFLDGETIVARIEAPVGTKVAARATYRRQLGQSGDWDFGLLARQDADGGGHLAVYAEGTAFVLKADQPPGAVDLPAPDTAWPDRSAPIEKTILHGYVVPESGTLRVVLARAESSLAAARAADASLAKADQTRAARLHADNQFWGGAPRLAGDWPDHWRRGFVYDLETLRAIVRPSAGVYRSRWDGMQIQVPRVVLAETALDMLLLSYADPETAQEVVLGTLRDAIAPNVPCTREDGSVNMVAVDGSACGTSPAWCWPFWCIGLIYRRTGDHVWLRELVPHLDAYLDWWLANRVGAEGQPFYLCGWESGQDASPRFNAAERGGGGIEGIRPVDLYAAIAQSARLLAGWLAELGADTADTSDTFPRMSERWRAVAEDYTERTRAMWDSGWFHDWTATGPTPVRDPMQIAPLMCGVATPEQVGALRSHLHHLPGHGEYSPLEWPPVALTVLESAFQAGERAWTTETAVGLLERVWSATDAPTHEPERPLPGVAHEHWPPAGEWHTEGYGWGAATVLLFLRYVAGVRDEPELEELAVEPHLPEGLRVPGRTYQVLNLPWRGERVDLTYSVGADGAVAVEKSWSRR
jgi:hypothetical protein